MTSRRANKRLIWLCRSIVDDCGEKLPVSLSQRRDMLLTNDLSGRVNKRRDGKVADCLAKLRRGRFDRALEVGRQPNIQPGIVFRGHGRGLSFFWIVWQTATHPFYLPQSWEVYGAIFPPALPREPSKIRQTGRRLLRSAAKRKSWLVASSPARPQKERQTSGRPGTRLAR
jgi:hypothetical protein